MGFTSRLRWLALLPGALVALPSWAENGVLLKFDWPTELHAQVQSSKTRTRQADGQPQKGSTMGSTFVMHAVRDGQQYRIGFDQLKIDTRQLGPLPAEQLALLNAVSRAALPSFRVSSQGDFVALDQPEAFQQALRTALTGLLPAGPNQTSSLAMLDKLLSVEVLSAMSRGEWDWLVGTWSGGERALDLGEDYVAQTEASMPLTNQVIAFQTRFTVTRRLACERQGRSLGCVELKATTRPDPAALKQAVTTFVAQLAPEAAAQMEKSLLALEMDTTVELVTEADTLVPHRFTLRKTISMPAAAGQTGGTLQVEETVQVYRYEASR